MRGGRKEECAVRRGRERAIATQSSKKEQKSIVQISLLLCVCSCIGWGV